MRGKERAESGGSVRWDRARSVAVEGPHAPLSACSSLALGHCEAPAVTVQPYIGHSFVRPVSSEHVLRARCQKHNDSPTHPVPEVPTV